MRLRFSIRDLFWLTLVVALVLGWYWDHQRAAAEHRRLMLTIIQQQYSK